MRRHSGTEGTFLIKLGTYLFRGKNRPASCVRSVPSIFVRLETSLAKGRHALFTVHPGIAQKVWVKLKFLRWETKTNLA